MGRLHYILTIIFFFILLVSCSTRHDFQNSKKEFYSNRNIKSIYLWNERLKDELKIYFSEKGDTVKKERILFPYKAVALFKGDTVDYRFYIYNKENNWWAINEYLAVLNDKMLNSFSSYVNLQEIDEHLLKIEYLGSDLHNFYLIKKQIIDTIIKIDTLISENKKSFVLESGSLKGKFVKLNLEEKIIVDSMNYSIISREIFFYRKEKLIFQEEFDLNDLFD